MKTCLIALSLTMTMVAGGAYADPITDRQDAMKRIGAQMRVLTPFAREEKPFDASAVSAAPQALQTEIKAYDVEALFPGGSQDGDTKASQKIWDDRAGFQAAVDKFASDIDAAVAAAPQDMAALQPQLASVGGNCSACHQAWRN